MIFLWNFFSLFFDNWKNGQCWLIVLYKMRLMTKNFFSALKSIDKSTKHFLQKLSFSLWKLVLNTLIRKTNVCLKTEAVIYFHLILSMLMQKKPVLILSILMSNFLFSSIFFIYFFACKYVADNFRWLWIWCVCFYIPINNVCTQIFSVDLHGRTNVYIFRFFAFSQHDLNIFVLRLPNSWVCNVTCSTLFYLSTRLFCCWLFFSIIVSKKDWTFPFLTRTLTP